MTDKQLGQTANTTPDRPLTVEELVKPWANFHGDLPDYDHPLRCVYESGIQYAVDLLATELKVKEYDICDGTEEFDGDLGGTLMNIVRAALPADEYGEPMWPSEVQKALTDRYAQGRADVLAEVRSMDNYGCLPPSMAADAIERRSPKNLVCEELAALRTANAGLGAANRRLTTAVVQHTGEIEVLKRERDEAREQFDRHVAWASDQALAAEAELARVREALEAELADVEEDRRWAETPDLDRLISRCERLEQALAPNPAPVEEWQPIETAPRDGSEFLGYHLCNDGYTGDWFALIDYSGDAEWPWEDGEGKHPEGFLTHWRPLPAPPRTRATEIHAGNAKKEGE